MRARRPVSSEGRGAFGAGGAGGGSASACSSIAALRASFGSRARSQPVWMGGSSAASCAASSMLTPASPQSKFAPIEDDLLSAGGSVSEKPVPVFRKDSDGSSASAPNRALFASSADSTAETIPFACFPEGLAHIRAAIEEGQLNRVVIAGCSNRTHDALFQRLVRQAGLNPYLLELVNLRDQCSRVHQQQPHLANRKAQELTRVAVGRVCAAQAVHKGRHPCLPGALVVGGGVAGMTAALAIADSGYHVHLVERTEALGGNLRHVFVPRNGNDPQAVLRSLVERVRA
ncbi:FAD-dependent oxidoreductase, partial [Anaerolineae bacterium CFX9]|nr:FAD-dependent oxidoreductase [Anaerolineae bacterium CFX9]